MWRNKVLWTEGLFLRPQHLQQQDRYLEHLVDRRTRSIASYPWGFETLEIDEAALSLGKLSLRSASGVLPDGTPFGFPLDDPPPGPMVIGENLKDRVIHLAIAHDRAGMPSVSLDETPPGGAVRVHARSAEVVDNVEGFTESAPMQLGALRLVLIADTELSGAYASMPVARVIERRADGQVLLDKEFIATTLDANASPVPRGWVHELHGLLRQRAEALAVRMTQPGRGGVAEIAEFLLLQVVNRYVGLFDHLANVPRLHPERLYTVCVEMAGELSTFGAERRLGRAYPPYQHDDLQLSFRPVLDHLRRVLSMVTDQTAIRIDLEEKKHGVRTGVVADKSLFRTARFVLAANADIPAEALRLRFPTQSKMAPVEKIVTYVNQQLPGVPMRALPVAPREIRYHAGFNYFEIDTNDKLWREIEQSAAVALHVPDVFPGLTLEFWAIRS